jgi:hypothetical protein
MPITSRLVQHQKSSRPKKKKLLNPAHQRQTATAT